MAGPERGDRGAQHTRVATRLLTAADAAAFQALRLRANDLEYFWLPLTG